MRTKSDGGSVNSLETRITQGCDRPGLGRVVGTEA